MDTEVPYMMSVKNLHKILDSIQNAAAPTAFGVDFLKDLGFTSSNDRGVIKLLKYLGMLDSSGKPQPSYREFMDHTKARVVLAQRLRSAYDDLFTSDKQAHTHSNARLKGWFKTKTGAGDAVAVKMASTFKSLASYADFSKLEVSKPPEREQPPIEEEVEEKQVKPLLLDSGLGLTFRVEIHLPDTKNVETYRSIFRALREELLS